MAAIKKNTEIAVKEESPFDPSARLQKALDDESKKRELMDKYIKTNLKEGTDYGKIMMKSRESKPTLFKPGAEKICSLLHLTPTFVIDDGLVRILGEGVIPYVCNLVSNDTGFVVGEGRGACSLAEKGNVANTAIKIAQKRAQIDAVLRVSALSDIFTQDLEDMPQGESDSSSKAVTPQVKAEQNQAPEIDASEGCPFGKNKGIKWRDMNGQQLKFYRDYYQGKLDDKSQEKYARGNMKALDAIQYELEIREDKEDGPHYERENDGGGDY